MSRPRKFPIEIKAGSTAIKIYLSPVRVSSNKDSNGGGLYVVSYDSFLVVHYRAGKRYRQRFKTLELAQAEATRIKALLLKEDASGLELQGKDLLAFSQAQRIAKDLGQSLDVLVNEHAAARRILGDVSVLEAAHFYKRHGHSVKEKKTVPEVVEELVAGLKADEKSEYHCRDIQRRLKVFSGEFPGLITQVDSKSITHWLRNVKGKSKAGDEVVLVAKSRNHYRNAVVQLFNFARDQGYLPKGLPTEAESVKALEVVPSENEIFTVEEMVKLLNAAPEHMIALIAIKAFSGIRTEEMCRIDWNALNFETKYITLNADVTKTKQRRLIPMPENLLQWLSGVKDKTGRIASRWSHPQSLFHAIDRLGIRHGIHVGANKFRNSYITYRVAVTHDVQRVALESGNSPRVIQREYLELATEDAGKRWFNIFPVAAVVGKPAVVAK